MRNSQLSFPCLYVESAANEMHQHKLVAEANSGKRTKAGIVEEKEIRRRFSRTRRKHDVPTVSSMTIRVMRAQLCRIVGKPIMSIQGKRSCA